MLTNKNGQLENEGRERESRFSGWRVHFYLFLLLGVAMGVVGCKPPGARALWDGKALLDRGEYTQAVGKFETATSLLKTNALAWNYLGLAYQQAGQANEAADAYKKALALDQNLVEVHYDLGCLWLEQNHPELAKAELTAFTLHRGDKSPEGWVKLGEAQMRLRDLADAEKSLNQARLSQPQNPEALNDLGVIQAEHNHGSEAQAFFNAALRAKPDYAPAMLNMAIVSELYLNNRPYAVQCYQEYLALNPRPANWDAVDAAALALEHEVQPGQAAPRPVALTNTVASAVGTMRQNRVPRITAPKPELQPPSNPKLQAQPPANQVEVLQPEPTVHTAEDSGTAQSSEQYSGSVAPNSIAASPKEVERRSFLSRVNPVNLFHSSPKTNQSSRAGGTQVALAGSEAQSKPVNYPRYSYHHIRKPAEGNREAAERVFAEGSQAQQAGQLSESAEDYRQAIQADPGYFDPYYNLGVVSVRSGNVAQALEAYETALAIEPGSHDARFNFALALKEANYPVDAANELEKLVAKFPNDAYAHYALGSLYAEQLRQPAKARQNFEKVLEIDPSVPQADAIHDWLLAHPR